MASDRLRGPNHQPWCNGTGSWFSGQGYNRVRVCPCGAEEHEPDFSVPVTKCRCSLKTKLVGDGCFVCNPERARELSEPEPERSPRELAIRELEELRDKLDHERRLRVKEAGDAADSITSERWWCSAGAFLKSIDEIEARLAKLREVRPC